jgi:hypothetical protein
MDIIGRDLRSETGSALQRFGRLLVAFYSDAVIAAILIFFFQQCHLRGSPLISRQLGLVLLSIQISAQQQLRQRPRPRTGSHPCRSARLP